MNIGALANALGCIMNFIRMKLRFHRARTGMKAGHIMRTFQSDATSK